MEAERRDAVGHAQAAHRPGAEAHGAVAIAGIDPGARQAGIGRPGGEQVGDARAGDIDLGERIILLQCDPRLVAVG
jgi:hypothetical protein